MSCGREIGFRGKLNPKQKRRGRRDGHHSREAVKRTRLTGVKKTTKKVGMRVTFGNFVSATRVGFRVAREDEGFENRRRVGFRAEELRWILGRERRRRFWQDEKNRIRVEREQSDFGSRHEAEFGPKSRFGFWVPREEPGFGYTAKGGFRVQAKKTVCDGPASGDTPGFESARRTQAKRR